MISIDKTQNGQKIISKKGETIKVQLTENPTTGCLWKIKTNDNAHLSLTNDAFEITGNAIGESGKKTFTFKVLKKGISKLLFSLGNPWGNDTIETFEITVESITNEKTKKNK